LRHFETDDFYWLPTNPRFQQSRPMPERLELLQQALAGAKGTGWALSGSLCGWGDPLIPQFSLVVFLTTATEVRLKRLHRRELSRYGAEAIAPGGQLHERHLEFVAWAARYDDGPAEIRSRAMHKAWLAGLPCPVLELDGSAGTNDLVSKVASALGAHP
jgi:hypothetical protein